MRTELHQLLEYGIPIDKKDTILFALFPDLLKTNDLYQLQEQGWVDLTVEGIYIPHPFFRKRNNFFRQKKQNDKINLYLIKKSKEDFLILTEGGVQERNSLLSEIDIRIASYQKKCEQTCMMNNDFLYSYLAVCEYWIYSAAYKNCVKLSDKILHVIKSISSKMTTPHQLSYLRVKEYRAYALKAQGLDTLAYNEYQEVIQLFISWKLEEHNPLISARIYKNLGILERSLKKFDKSRINLTKAIQIFKDHHIEDAYASTLQSYGNLFLVTNDHETALLIYQKALDIILKVNDRYAVAEVLSNIGLCYRHLGKLSEAEKYYKDSLQISISYNDLKAQAQIFQNLGVIQWAARRFDLSIPYYKQALEIYINLDIEHKQAKIYQNLSMAYKNIGLLPDSITYIKEAIKRYNNIGDSYTKARATLNLGMLLWRSKNYLKSEEYLLQSLSYSNEADNQQIRGESYLNLSVLYWSMGDLNRSIFVGKKAMMDLMAVRSYDSVIQLTINLGTMLSENQQIEESTQYLQQGISLAEKKHHHYQLGILYKNLAKNLLKKKNLLGGKEYLDKAKNNLLNYSKDKHLIEIYQLLSMLDSST